MRLRPLVASLAVFSVVGWSGLLFAQAPAGQVAPPPKKGFAGAGGDYKQYSPETLESGQKFYTANCAFCHGGGAKGGESGPDLLRSTIVLHDDSGEVLGAFIRVGRPDKGMPRFALPPDQVKDIAAFLHDRVRAAAERGTYQILNIVVGDPKAGESYFNDKGRCATCHSPSGDLAHIGSRYDPVTLQTKILQPREARSSDPQTATMVKIIQPSGEVIEGQLHRYDDFSVSIQTKDGNIQSYPRTSEDVPKLEILNPLQVHIDLLAVYTDTDIHNLTAYLLTLK